ncbi:MAG: hypothetical protein M1834_008771 [Cirrosporium novae-zelandiae]|nr:MAG: hypothetical protein M1834_008771 [Cirrosporium novae-zelandiae]
MSAQTQKGIVLRDPATPPSLESIPIPSPTPGSLVIQVLGSLVNGYFGLAYINKLPYPISTPLVMGTACIGRVHAIGPDTTRLSQGQLVMFDVNVRARDAPDVSLLMGMTSGWFPEGKKLMDGEFRNGTFAEYAKVPLENVLPLDEEKLCGKLGYDIADLCHLPQILVGFGGMSDVGVKSGDAVLVAPATGGYGGGAVEMALALGCTVVAAGRNEEKLKEMEQVLGKAYGQRLSYAKLTGSVEEDIAALTKASPRGEGFDHFVDFSPPSAAKSTHIKASIMTLKHCGKCVLMGGIMGDIELPYWFLMTKNVTVRARFMYDRATVVQLIKMAEAGIVKLGKDVGIKSVGPYGLDKFKEALDEAAKDLTWGTNVILKP